jgi:hypothetical protein
MKELGELRDLLTREGLSPPLISGGGTGTFDIDPDARVLTELQVGSYVFMDRQYNDVWEKPGDRPPFETSLFVQTTVISANRTGMATTDAGYKSFATDAGPPKIARGAPEGATYFFFGDEQGGIFYPADKGTLRPGDALAPGRRPNWLDTPDVVRERCMTTAFRTLVAAVAITCAATFSSSNVQAGSSGIGIRAVPGDGIDFSYESGGYCDRWGCPDEFWNYPLYYCPVFYDGSWYKGPVYYRRKQDELWFWIHGGWHRDEWDGPRPHGACIDRFGPVRGYNYYEANGFVWNDGWRRRWWNENRDFYPGWDFDRWQVQHRDWDRDHNYEDWRAGRHHGQGF